MSMKVSPINNYNSHTSYGAGEYRSGKGVQKNLGEIQKRLQYGVGPSKTFKLSKGAEKTAARAFFVAAALLLFGLFSHANKEGRKIELLEKYAQNDEDSLIRDDIENDDVTGCTLRRSESIDKEGKTEIYETLNFNRKNGDVDYPSYVTRDIAEDVCTGKPLFFDFYSHNAREGYFTLSGKVTGSYNPEKNQLYTEKIEEKVAKEINKMYM